MNLFFRTIMSNVKQPATETGVRCFHCGDRCASDQVISGEKCFCCNGCKQVYELLNENNLCTYYNLNQAPGVSPRENEGRFAYLDLPEINNKLVHFRTEGEAHVTFYTPKMHCSSCIWLLENLHKLNPAVASSSVNFLRKEITIIYNDKNTSLSTLANLLTRIGYEPVVSLNDVEKKVAKRDYSPVIKIGVAGFCFGNIMMLSFPEYFSFGNFYDQEQLKPFFRYMNIVLALPVFFYCASEFFVSAWKGLAGRYLNIDTPIALAVGVTFIRSVYEITTRTGAGYMDSMSGIVFFMLLGRYFQAVTYDTLSFERDYRSYFPVAVTVKSLVGEESMPVNQLKKGDHIYIRSHELIPVDAVLLSDYTHIDYSFVTGEAAPVRKEKGALIYAGAKQLEGAIDLEVSKAVSQSYLTRLWNTDAESREGRSQHQTFVDRVNKFFTIGVLIAATVAYAGWAFTDLHRAFDAFTAVLIVACPCGLLLASTFSNASILRMFGRYKLYLKNAGVIEKLANINTIVFDKTGTITHGSEVTFKGPSSANQYLELAAALCAQSSHPLSRKISSRYPAKRSIAVSGFEEVRGMGIKGQANGHYFVVGSDVFVHGRRYADEQDLSSKVYLSVDGMPCGYFSVNNAYREGLEEVIRGLEKNFELHLLSGDHDGERENLQALFAGANLHFNQTPDSKLTYIRQLQQKGRHVLMIGDGLNDAGALKQSDVGIAVSDDTNTFSPACDAILDGSAFNKLRSFLSYSRSGKYIISLAFGTSLIYNFTGLFFAVQGTLSPVIAAVLMPASSVTIVLLSTLAGRWAGRILK